jgi:uncharacterized membrane protein YphA (DoxX/SURF4 family)
MQRISIAAIVFLVLLRLAIGWHFLFEGLQKVESVYVGETVTNRPFSSAGYFREATGPLAGPLRWAMGDPDAVALSRLEVQPLPEGEEPSRETLYLRTPPGLDRDWRSYLERFEKHYRLDDKQRDEARGKLQQAEIGVVLWLEQPEPDENTPEQRRDFPTGQVLRKVPTAERVKQYRDKLAQIRETIGPKWWGGGKLWVFGRDVEKAGLRKARRDADMLRTGLMRDLDGQTQALMRSLELVVARPVLTPLERLASTDSNDDRWWWARNSDLGQGNKLLKIVPKDDKARPALLTVVNGLQALADSTRNLTPLRPEKIGPEPVTPLDAESLRTSLEERAAGLSKYAAGLKNLAERDDLKQYASQVEADSRALAAGATELPEVGPLTITVESNRLIGWIDWLTRWGLTVVGACLLVGLFTRLNCWLAAGFLLMTYLAMPPFPWLPAAPQSEGNYLFVNKNLIEMLALCALGTMATGRWFGLDAVLHWFRTTLFGEKQPAAKTPAATTKPAA